MSGNANEPALSAAEGALQSHGGALAPMDADSDSAFVQGAVAAGDVRALARTSLNFFAALCLPDVCTIPFPPYYQGLWETLTASMQRRRAFDKYALGFPRGHAKTLFVKLLCAYAILETDLQFVLIIGASQPRAMDILRDVGDILDSPQVRAVYGNWREDLTTDRGEFKFFRFGEVREDAQGFKQRPTRALAAAGQGTSIRGFNVGNMRPSFIICDDAQTKECATSPGEAMAYTEWFFGTLMKAKDPTRCTYLYVGNMYRDLRIRPNLYACLLRNLQFSRHWKSFIVGAILADGKALWEELQPLHQLLEEFAQDSELGQGEIFAAEVLNDPSYTPKTGLDFTRIHILQAHETALHAGELIIVDPSGYKKSSDATAFGRVRMVAGRPHVAELLAEVMSPGDTIWKALNLCMKHGISVVAVENVAYQDTLLYWFELICRQQQINGISFVPIQTGGKAKFTRILRSFEEAMAGEVTFSPEAFSMWAAQATLYEPQRRNNQDDILDVVAYASKAFLEYGHLCALPGTGAVTQDLGHIPDPSACDAGF